MVSGEREVEMTALPIGNNPSIRKLKIAIQKLTDRRPDDLSFFGPQNFRASLHKKRETLSQRHFQSDFCETLGHPTICLVKGRVPVKFGPNAMA